MPTKKLAEYHAKRNFSSTTEPKGKPGVIGNIFVVQKHDASHLHYDLRLEVDGVLKSWAVPKGIPKVLNEKHLAIQTEDHPLEYAKFSGVIPEGNYGAGTVEIWDHGQYEQIFVENKPNNMPEAIEHGSIKFVLKGKKLKGNYAMVRFKREHNKDQWLIFRIPKNA